jgi:hypothetical protein
MRVRWLAALALTVLALASCSIERGVRPGSEPAVAAGMARLYVYRDLAPYASTLWTSVSLDGRRIGDSAPGTVFYRDVPPGTYEVEVRSDKLYPNQFKTVALRPGSVTYVKIQEQEHWSETSWNRTGTTFIVQIVAPARGAQEIAGLPLTPG